MNELTSWPYIARNWLRSSVPRKEIHYEVSFDGENEDGLNPSIFTDSVNEDDIIDGKLSTYDGLVFYWYHGGCYYLGKAYYDSHEKELLGPFYKRRI